MKVLSFLTRSTLQRRIAQDLRRQSFVVETAASANECLQLARLVRYEAILVDADHPVKFGNVLALVKQLRQENPDASLFVFTGYLNLQQRLGLFDSGSDDCVADPFFASEMLVRLGLSIRLHQAVSNLASLDTVTVLRCGDLELDPVRRRVARSGKPIALRSKEFRLLEYLMRNADRPATRTMMMENVWNASFEGLTNVIDVYMSALRRKIDRDFALKLIQTNRGIGYTLTCTDRLPSKPISHAEFPVQRVGGNQFSGFDTNLQPPSGVPETGEI
jgi:two-component system OmpR family response regulator